jgi:carbon monoxide dehydrogenase subunit G
MNVSGTKELSAPRDVVWGVINEPEEMAKLMPGVESFEVKDDRHWTARVKVPLGLGALAMTMNFERLEERPPEFASMRSKGTGVGALMDMTTSFTLTETGDGTSMAWEAEVKIAGPVGAMGQRVLQPIVNQQVQQVLAALEKRVNEAAGGGTAGAEQGIHPGSPEAYESEPEGPTHSPQD